MKILLHIERLGVHGLAITSAQRRRLEIAIRHELTQLIRDGELAHGLQNGAAVPSLSAPHIKAAASHDPTALGRQIAQAIYGTFRVARLPQNSTRNRARKIAADSGFQRALAPASPPRTSR